MRCRTGRTGHGPTRTNTDAPHVSSKHPVFLEKGRGPGGGKKGAVAKPQDRGSNGPFCFLRSKHVFYGHVRKINMAYFITQLGYLSLCSDISFEENENCKLFTHSGGRKSSLACGYF